MDVFAISVCFSKMQREEGVKTACPKYSPKHTG